MKSKVQKTNDEWKEELAPELYHVAREKGTEAAFTGKYVHEKSDGMYHCAACGAALFSSRTKFDSGTGWPSFTDAEKGKVVFARDSSHGMVRTEVQCASCGAHLGHVFDDGPAPQGKRFCINSCSLDLKEKGD